MNKHIFFTGFMASGKSRTGRALAERLNRPYVDTDAVIVERAGKTISEIFEQDGEAKFREMEREVVAEFAKNETPHIILPSFACGQNPKCFRNASAARTRARCLPT